MQNFRASLKLTQSLLSLERGYPDPAPPNDKALVDGLRAGAAVLMVATFEDFVRSMVKEHVGSLRSRTPAVIFGRLPDRIQVGSVFTSLQRALDGPEFGPKLEKVDRLPTIAQAASDVVNGRVSSDAIASTRGNPGPDVVKEILLHCDIEDAFNLISNRFQKNWKSEVAQHFIRDKLQEIVDRRHRVAHSGRPSGSRSDLNDALRFLRTLASTLDDEVRIKMNSVYRKAKP